MRICSKCQEEKDESEFYLRNKKFHLFQSMCKKCSNKTCCARQKQKVAHLNRRKGGQRKYTLDETVFDHMNEVSAYWLGFLYADGYNSETKMSISLSLAEQDKNHVEKFKNFLKSNKNIKIYSPTREGEQNMHTLVINSKKLSEKLRDLGCVQNKTFKIKFPTFLPHELIKHFIRGYFDGDGSVGKYFIKTKNNYNCSASIVSNKNFLQEISTIIGNNCGINFYLFEKFNGGKNDVKSISTNGSIQVYKFLSWIYNGSSVYLDRKYLKYEEIKNWLLTRKYKRGQKTI